MSSKNRVIYVNNENELERNANGRKLREYFDDNNPEIQYMLSRCEKGY